MTLEEISKGLKSSGLGQIADEIAALAQPCVRFHTASAVDANIPLGASKLGGCPDLPLGVEWPAWQDEPLGFLGQIDLKDLREFPCCGSLPASGLLYFFYDMEQRTWGFDPKDAGSWTVIFHSEAGPNLVRRNIPDEIPQYVRHTPCTLSYYEATSLPGWETFAIQGLQMKREEIEAYAEFLDQWCRADSHGASHQLLGHPEELQGEMQLECQLASNGLYCGDGTDYEDEQAVELESGATEWRLLFQLDSDERAGMQWGDLGRLYFWIRRADLNNHDFDKVWMILQCG